MTCEGLLRGRRGLDEVADATAPTLADTLLDRYDPSIVVVVAGATPVMRPLQGHTWETFSVNWHADVRIAFLWLGAILTRPMRPGGRVTVVSTAGRSGAPLTPEGAGAAVRELTDRSAASVAPAYLLTGAGLHELG